MSVRASLVTVAVVVGTVFVAGCAQTSSPTSPSSSVGAGATHVESTVSFAVAQLTLVQNLLTSANQQLTLFLVPPNPVIPPNPIVPPNPISPQWDQNTLNFYLKANEALGGIPPNPISPVTDALNIIIGQANTTLDLIELSSIPPNPIIPQIVTQAELTITLATNLLSCSFDVCSTP